MLLHPIEPNDKSCHLGSALPMRWRAGHHTRLTKAGSLPQVFGQNTNLLTLGASCQMYNAEPELAIGTFARVRPRFPVENGLPIVPAMAQP